MMPTLTTPRLILRPVVESDIDAIFAACSNPRVTEHTLFETHADREASAEFVREYAFANYARGIPDPFAIAQKDTPEDLIGCCGGMWTEGRCNQSVEIGYWIAEPHWGQGVATEAVGALLSFIFEVLQPVRVQAHTVAENAASARVLEKAGLVYEGTLRQAYLRRGRYWDLKLFSALRHEWQ